MKCNRRSEFNETQPFHLNLAVQKKGKGRGEVGGGGVRVERGALISYKDKDYHNKERDLSTLAHFHHKLEEERESELIL